MFMCALFGTIVMALQLQIGWNGVEMQENALTTALKALTTANTLMLGVTY